MAAPRIELALLLLLGCSGSPRSTTPTNTSTTSAVTTDSPAPRRVRHWRVYDGDLEILELSDEPGPLLSTAMPPPGARPVTHPFLSATALDAGHEDQLRQLLVASQDVDGFVRALEGAGFRVVPQ